MTHYVAPAFPKTSFHCPFCHVYAHQRWNSIHLTETWDQFRNVNLDQVTEYGMETYDRHEEDGPIMNYLTSARLRASQCSHCHRYAVWDLDQLEFPSVSMAPPPNEDMPDSVRTEYEEAAVIAAKSPRGAGALLRLALHKLLMHLGIEEENFNKAIGEMVRHSVSAEVQMSMDIVRLIANECVHSPTLNTADKAEDVQFLFGLVNFVVEDRISRPAKIATVFGSFPATTLAQIQKRDEVEF